MPGRIPPWFPMIYGPGIKSKYRPVESPPIAQGEPGYDAPQEKERREKMAEKKRRAAEHASNLARARHEAKLRRSLKE